MVATVYAAGKSPTTDSVSLAALQANSQRCPQYPGTSMNELGHQGTVPVQLPRNGPQTGTWGLGTILGCLQTPIPLGAVTDVTVIDANGSPEVGPNSQLTAADLATPSDFADYGGNASDRRRRLGDPVRPAVARQPRRRARPATSTTRCRSTDRRSRSSIDVFEGPHLAVTATASPTTVAAGARSHSPRLCHPQTQPGLAYGWNFGGGAPDSTAPSPQVKFAAGGQYQVTLQVTDAAGGGGGSDDPDHGHLGRHPTPSANPKGPSTRADTQLRPHARWPAGQPHPVHTGHRERRPRLRVRRRAPTGQSAPAARAQPRRRRGLRRPERYAVLADEDAQSPTATGAGPGGAQAPPRGASHARAQGHGAKPNAGRPPSGSSPNPLARPVDGLLISDVSPLAPGASSLVHVVAAPPATAPAIRTPTTTSPCRRSARASPSCCCWDSAPDASCAGRRRWRPLRLGS